MKAANKEKIAQTSHDHQLNMAKDGWKFTRQGKNWTSVPPQPQQKQETRQDAVKKQTPKTKIDKK